MVLSVFRTRFWLKTLHLKGVHSKEVDTNFLRKDGQSVVLISCSKKMQDTETVNRQRQTTQCRLWRQVAQLSQRDRATHELLRFAKLRSGIFEPPFRGLGNVDASCVPVRRWKKCGRFPIGDNWILTAVELRSVVFEPSFGGLSGKVGAFSIPRWKAPDQLPMW